MKYRMRLIGVCLGCLFAFAACEMQNEPEPKVVYHPFAKSEAYYENLRAYKKTNHQIAFGWFGAWNASGASVANMLSCVPDSMDLISIWGEWNNLSPEQIADKDYVRKVKGTKVIFTIFAHAVPLLYYEKSETGKLVLKPEGIQLYAKAMVDSVTKYDYDGLDLDYEPGYGGTGALVDAPTSKEGMANMEVFVRELSRYLGPKSGTGRILAIDGVPYHLNPGLAELFDYGIVQAYNCGGDTNLQSRFENAFAVGWKPEQYIFAEDFESYCPTGGNPNFADLKGNIMPSFIGMAKFQPKQGKKGGVGTYHMENEYVLTPDYKYMRQAIQIMNPAAE